MMPAISQYNLHGVPCCKASLKLLLQLFVQGWTAGLDTWALDVVGAEGGGGGVGGAADHLNTYTVSRFYPYHSFLFVPCSHQFHIRTILSEPVNEAITADLNMRMVAKHGSSKYTDQLADMTVSSSSLTYQIGPDAKKMMFKEGSSGCTDEGGGGGLGNIGAKGLPCSYFSVCSLRVN